MNKKTSKNHLDKIAQKYNEAEGFEKQLMKYKYESIKPHLYGKRLLDVGCGYGDLCYQYKDFFDLIVGIDGSRDKIDKATKKYRSKKIKFIHTFFEDYEENNNFHTIIATNVLEHVDNPVAFLSRFKKKLSNNGRMIVTVPNAKGLHKRIGKAMGMINDYYKLTTDDLGKGHKRIYDLDRLKSDFVKAGLAVVDTSGILLKPLSHKQMEEWPKELCDAFYVVGKELPEYCSSLLIVGKKK